MNPPNNLRCEYLVNPIEIDIPFPRFSWILEHEQRNQSQSAYRIKFFNKSHSLISYCFPCDFIICFLAPFF